MALSPTIVAVGGVTISVTGAHTGDLLQKISDTFNDTNVSNDVVTVGSGVASLPAAPTTGGLQTLVIPADYTGSLEIPAGYEFVVYQGTGTLTGGDTSTVVVGDNLNYTGSAGTIIGTSGTGAVTSTNPQAQLSFFTGNYTVAAAGDGSQVFVDPTANVNVTLTGSNAGVTFNQPTATGGQSNATASTGGTSNSAVLGGVNDTALVLTGDNTIFANSINNVIAIQGVSNNVVFVDGTATVNQTAGAATIVAGTGHVNLNATGGSQVLFDNTGANLINAGPSTFYAGFNGANPASTIVGSTGGADTVFATSSFSYDGTNASSAIIAAFGAGATVLSAANETVFATGGGLFHAGTGTFGFVGLGGGADTITADSNSGSVLVFSGANETAVLQTSNTATNGIVVMGDNTMVDATNTTNANLFLVLDSAGFAGASSTLVGSNAGHDQFGVFVDASNTAPRTVEIQNWHAGDSLLLANLDPTSNGALSAEDSAAIDTFLQGGSTQFTLTDGTTVKFTNTTETTFTIGHL